MSLWTVFTSPAAWVAVAVTAAFFIYKRGTKNFDVFIRQGIAGPKPYPFVGTMWGVWKRNMVKHDHGLVAKYGSTFGTFDGVQPVLVTIDTDLIRSVFVKDFDHFVNRRTFPVTHKYGSKMLSLMRDQEWKDVRSQLSPTFTSGRIRKMSSLIVDCSNDVARKLLANGRGNASVDVKKIFSNFTMDVIAKCAFGMTIDNLDDDNDEFMKNARTSFFSAANKSPMVLFAFVAGDLLVKLFGEKLIFTKEFLYFFDVLEKVISERKDKKQEYNDFIETTTEALSQVTRDDHGTQVNVFTPEEVEEIVIAQSVIFLLAGFDTTASTLTTTVYRLAKDPEIQEKLYDQVMSKLEQYGQVCHEMVTDFPYLDQVIHEVLRMHPPIPRLERECNKDGTYNGVRIKKGMVVSMAVFPLHYSEENYSEPEKFDPDRWAPENKPKRNPYAYAPFGHGPRNCIGMRFAMEELKIALCTVVSQLKFVAVDETPDRLEYDEGFTTILQPMSVIVGVEER